MIRITFDVVGEKQVDRAIERFSKGVQDYRPAWESIRGIFWNAEKKKFEAADWEPLSPIYAAWKEEHYPGKPILQRTGALMASLTGHNEGAIIEIHPLWMQVGSALGYGRYHQKGTSRMPQRKVIDLVEENKRSIMKAIQRHLLNVSERAGIPAP